MAYTWTTGEVITAEKLNSSQTNNYDLIIDFEGDENDQELIYLLEDLLQLFSKSGIDVRNYLNPIREKMEQRYAQ